MNAENRDAAFEIDHLAVARSLSKLLEGEADANEANGALTPTVVGALRETGLLWLLVPREMGGGGTDLLTNFFVGEELARADGSIGWCFMANSTASAFAATYLGDRAVDAMYGGRWLPILAGAGQPNGRARLVKDGIEGSGSYSFGSGSTYSDWVSGVMLVEDEKGELLLEGGAPVVRLAFAPRDKIEFLGNWNVGGLKGTGSVDFRILPQFIHDDFAPVGLGTLQRGGPFFSLGMLFFALSGHAAVSLGLMKRALEEVARIAADKRRLGASQNVIDNALFRDEFAMHEADYRAARAYLVEVISDAQKTASAGETVSEEQHSRLRQANAWSHAAGMRVVPFCYRWAGSQALRRPSVLGRVMDDMRAAYQHLTVDPGTYADVAPTLLKSWAR
jgi:alkylation response protein AidB-like acyl-CoA dehydrogenase